VIFKFQHGDKLVGEILQASSYSEGASMVPASNTGSSKIKCLISVVISASGGVGKTSIASALCIKAASKGIKSFYLNLDSLQEPFVFESNTEQAEMSKVLYHLKEATPNALSRIEAYRSISKMSGVHHFGGFENCNEGDDVTATDIQMLFDWFKRESTYGRVIVDLPGHMNAMYLKALELCDEILLISSEDRMCELKSNRLKSFLNKYDSTKGSNLLNKLQFIRNKNTSVFEASMDKDECRDISSKTKVPFCPELILDCSERNIYRLLNNNPEFSSALSKVLEG
jgi:cellulose biosynthesis protein BcsQ